VLTAFASFCCVRDVVPERRNAAQDRQRPRRGLDGPDPAAFHVDALRSCQSLTASWEAARSLATAIRPAVGSVRNISWSRSEIAPRPSSKAAMATIWARVRARGSKSRAASAVSRAVGGADSVVSGSPIWIILCAASMPSLFNGTPATTGTDTGRNARATLAPTETTDCGGFATVSGH